MGINKKIREIKATTDETARDVKAGLAFLSSINYAMIDLKKAMSKKIQLSTAMAALASTLALAALLQDYVRSNQVDNVAKGPAKALKTGGISDAAKKLKENFFFKNGISAGSNVLPDSMLDEVRQSTTVPPENGAVANVTAEEIDHLTGNDDPYIVTEGYQTDKWVGSTTQDSSEQNITKVIAQASSDVPVYVSATEIEDLIGDGAQKMLLPPSVDESLRHLDVDQISFTSSSNSLDKTSSASTIYHRGDATFMKTYYYDSDNCLDFTDYEISEGNRRISYTLDKEGIFQRSFFSKEDDDTNLYIVEHADKYGAFQRYVSKNDKALTPEQIEDFNAITPVEGYFDSQAFPDVSGVMQNMWRIRKEAVLQADSNSQAKVQNTVPQGFGAKSGDPR